METLFCEFYPPAIASNLPEIASNLQPIATNLPAVASNLPAIASNMPEIESSFPAIASNLSQQLHSIFQQLHAIYLSHQLHLTKTFDSFSLSPSYTRTELQNVNIFTWRKTLKPDSGVTCNSFRFCGIFWGLWDF